MGLKDFDFSPFSLIYGAQNGLQFAILLPPRKNGLVWWHQVCLTFSQITIFFFNLKFKKKRVMILFDLMVIFNGAQSNRGRLKFVI